MLVGEVDDSVGLLGLGTDRDGDFSERARPVTSGPLAAPDGQVDATLSRMGHSAPNAAYRDRYQAKAAELGLRDHRLNCETATK